MEKKTIVIISILLLIFTLDIALFARIFFPFIVFFNILAIISSALSIDSVSKSLFFKFKYLKRYKKVIILVSNTILICSLIIILLLGCIEARRNENASNKIRTLEIKTEMDITTEDKNVGDSKYMSGVRNYIYLSSEDRSISYTFVSEQPTLSVKTATNTSKIYFTHKPSKTEKIYGKQIKILEQINDIKFNFNKLIELSGINIEETQATSIIKFSFYINSILTGVYHSNFELKKIEKGKIFGIDVSKVFRNIEKKYNYLEKSRILN